MSADTVQALDRLFELAGRVGELMRASLADRDLTPARAEVLLVLHHRGEPMVQRELSQALRCTPRHVTGLVDVLESGGLVERRRHPSDRRALLVALTPTGTTAAERMDAERHAAALAIFGDVPAADVAGFLALTDHVLDRLQLDAASGPARRTARW